MSFPAFTAGRKLSKESKIGEVVAAYNALVDNLSTIFTSLTSRVQLDSILLKNVALIAGTSTIPHTLGRTLSGWSIVGINGVAAVYAPTTQPMTGSYLTLVSSAPVTVSLLVF